MLVHNGRLLAGTLPLAEVYSYEHDGQWNRLVRLDQTPEVVYRRAWTMAEHDGQVFCSTLPSGRIHAFSAGEQTQWGESLSSDWHHITATKSSDRLALYVDGEQVSQTPPADIMNVPLESEAPLQIGSGENGPLNGRLADIRIYQRLLNPREIEALSQLRPESP
jgi:hypothetical protein